MNKAKQHELQAHAFDNEQPFKRYSSDGGFNDKLKKLVAATDKHDGFAKFLFSAFGKVGFLTKYKFTEKYVLNKVVKMGDTHTSRGYSMPLHVDTLTISVNAPVELKGKMVNPPVELVKKAIAEAPYLAIMNNCMCRTVGKCEHYPIDLGCMWLGPAAKICVENGIAHEATVEECYAHIDRATAAGLSAGAYFVEFEQYAWGFKDKDMPDYMAFCFCCPCCCQLVKFENGAGGQLKRILNQSTGWHAESQKDLCNGCKTCVESCPRNMIKFKNGRPIIDEDCTGCGQCVLKCPTKAMHVVQYAPMKENLHDYFPNLTGSW